jgi:hypothetical protein
MLDSIFSPVFSFFSGKPAATIATAAAAPPMSPPPVPRAAIKAGTDG